VKSLFLFKRKK